MKISVITVCFNSAATIRQCIESVLGQEGVDFEHVIVDGKSSDITPQIVLELAQEQRASQVIRFISEPDKGIYDAMNKGIQMATGDVVGFLNADDFYANSKVLALIQKQISETQAAGCYGDLDLIDPVKPELILRHWHSGKMPENRMSYGWHPAHPTFYVKRQNLLEINGFNQKYRIAADYELMLRLIEKSKIKLTYIPEVLVKMRAGGASNGSLKRILRANRECLAAWQDNSLEPSVFLIPGKLMWKLRQRMLGLFS